MAIPTREECITFAKNLLADPDGEVFTSSVLADPFEAAFAIMMAEMNKDQVAQVRKTVYVNLPAYTSQLTPAAAGIADFGEIINLEERSVGAASVISAATNATPIQITTVSAHGLSTDSEVIVSGVLGNTAANGRWFANVSNSLTFTLIGSIGNAAYTSGGAATSSSDRFQIVEQRSELPQRDPADTLNVYAWDNDTFEFIGATTQRQLKIAYFSSGAAPATGSVGVDGSKNFLSYMTAAIAGPTRGRTTISDAYEAKCLGPKRDRKAGFLFDLIQPMVRTMSRQPVRMKPYRSGGRTSNLPASGFVYNPTDTSSSDSSGTLLPYQWYFLGQTINGTNAVFTVDRAPTRYNVFKNGQLMIDAAGGAPSSDYSLSGVTITFESGSIPQSGDTIYIEYAV